MKYRITTSTKNAGEYIGDQIAALSKAKSIVNAARAGRKLLWRQEGGDICGYASKEDMDDEDKAVARLRPAVL